MSTIKCYIDRREIDKAIKLQRAKRSKITLVDPTGLRLAINNASASWNCNYRRRGVDFNGKRHPQRTLKLGDLSALTPNAARLKMEEIKAEVRNGGDPAKRIIFATTFTSASTVRWTICTNGRNCRNFSLRNSKRIK